MLVNWSFICQLAGGRRLIGYVPGANADRRGVTVATGVDLGHYTPRDIETMSIPDSLKTKLKPYAGLTGDAAAAALDGQPLGLTSAEAEALDDAVKKPIVRQTIARYNAAVGDQGHLPPFETLPEAAQTVIASVALHYGAALPERFPHFWHCVCNQDWPAAAAALEDCADARHKREAGLLRSVYS